MSFSRSSIFTVAILAAGTMAQAAVTKATLGPSGWSVGETNSTYQHWITNSAADNLAGTPNNGYDTAGVSLTSPLLSVNAPGYSSGSSGMFYSPAGAYSFEAAIGNNASGSLPSNAGTYVIVQVLSILPAPESITSIILTDSSDTPLSVGSSPIAHLIYGAESGYSTPFGPQSVQVDLYEFWVPDFTGDFNVLTSVLEHTGVLEVRVDTKIVGADENDSVPFAPVTVPEPASLALAAFGGSALLLRRRK